MATTFLQHQTSVLEVFKRTDKTTELKRALNEAYSEMCAFSHPRKLQDQIYKNTVIGREEYPLPDAVLRINHPIRLIDPSSNSASASYQLEFLTKKEYDEVEPNPNATSVSVGKPWAYTIWKNSLLLTDVPDRVYTLEVNIGGLPYLMVEDVDETIFQANWDETIKAGALSRLFALIGLTAEADLWQRVYRYGFAGNEGFVTGGLELLRQTSRDLQQAPVIVKYNGGF